MMRPVRMPIRRAASMFIESARIALPVQVRCTRSWSAAMTTTAVTKMTWRVCSIGKSRG